MTDNNRERDDRNPVEILLRIALCASTAFAMGCGIEDDPLHEDLGQIARALEDSGKDCTTVEYDVSGAPGYEDADWAVSVVRYTVCSDGYYCLQWPAEHEIQGLDGVCGYLDGYEDNFFDR